MCLGLRAADGVQRTNTLVLVSSLGLCCHYQSIMNLDQTKVCGLLDTHPVRLYIHGLIFKIVFFPLLIGSVQRADH